MGFKDLVPEVIDADDRFHSRIGRIPKVDDRIKSIDAVDVGNGTLDLDPDLFCSHRLLGVGDRAGDIGIGSYVCAVLAIGLADEIEIKIFIHGIIDDAVGDGFSAGRQCHKTLRL